MARQTAREATRAKLEFIRSHYPQWVGLPSTRGEAKEKNTYEYFTGRPCHNGHIAPRTTNEGACKLCERDRINAAGFTKPGELRPTVLGERMSDRDVERFICVGVRASAKAPNLALYISKNPDYPMRAAEELKRNPSNIYLQDHLADLRRVMGAQSTPHTLGKIVKACKGHAMGKLAYDRLVEMQQDLAGSAFEFANLSEEEQAAARVDEPAERPGIFRRVFGGGR